MSVSSGSVRGPRAHGSDRLVTSTSGDAEITGIKLSFHPWDDNGFPSLGKHGLVPDQRLLDAFAREYAKGQHLTNTGALSEPGPEMPDFFLIWLPNRLINISAGLEVAPEDHRLELATAEGMGTAQWLAHLCGYYAAVWLRTCWTVFNVFDPDQHRQISRQFSMRDRSFGVLYKRLLDKSRDAALYGSDSDAIEFSRSTLRMNTPQPSPARTVTRLLRADRLFTKLSNCLPGEAGMFGYNAGFLRDILPPSLNAPTNAKPFTQPYFTGDPNLLFDAHFALPEPLFLAEARKTYAAISSGDDQGRARLNEAVMGRKEETPLLARQQAGETAAAVLYRVGIRGATVYRDFDQAQYDRLLAWNSSAVMINAASGYTALSAYATRDAALARRQITAHILWWVFGFTYLIGVVDRRNDSVPLSESLPRFVTAERCTPQASPWKNRR